MRLIERDEIYLLLDKSICPFCDIESNRNTWDKFSVNEKIFYGRCKICDGSVKLIKRRINHFHDYRFCEFVFKDIHRQTNAVKGYQISKKTFEKNKTKLEVASMYSKLGFSDLDDLIKTFN
jgi:hypothetical protein